MGLWTKLLGGAEEKNTQRQTAKTVVTAEELGLALSEASLRAGNRLFQEFANNGVIAQLSSQQQVRLALELLLFELVCKALSLVRFYGEDGSKVSPFLTRSTLTTFAESLQVEEASTFINVSSYTEAALVQFDSHYQYYAQDIWELWNADSTEDFNKELGVMGIGGIGEKIVQKILHPVLGISLEKPLIDRKAGPDWRRKLEEENKEWENVPHRFELVSFCSIYAVTSQQAMKPIFDEFVLS